MNGMGSATSFRVEGRPEPARGQSPVTDVRWITGDYFNVMGIPLLKGRAFDSRDAGEANNVVVVNETMARTFLARWRCRAIPSDEASSLAGIARRQSA